MAKAYVWISLIDFLTFVLTWVMRSIAHLSTFGMAVYWLSAFVGLAIAVYGFIVLARSINSSGDQLGKSVLSILFALIPGCVGLMTLLSHLGTKPV